MPFSILWDQLDRLRELQAKADKNLLAAMAFHRAADDRAAALQDEAVAARQRAGRLARRGPPAA